MGQEKRFVSGKANSQEHKTRPGCHAGPSEPQIYLPAGAAKKLGSEKINEFHRLPY
jgi:hypothetical protein